MKLQRKIIMLSVLLNCSIVVAQQPADWRPNVSEDNKAATWDDTSLFLSNTLMKYSRGIRIDGRSTELASVSAPKHCILEVASHVAEVEKSACKSLQDSTDGILGISLSPLGSELSARVGRDGYVIEAFRPGSPAANAQIEVGSVLLSVELRRKYTSAPQWFHLRSPDDLHKMVQSDAWETATSVKLVFKDKANRYKTRFVEVKFDGACQAPQVLDEECMIDLTKVDPLSIQMKDSLLTFSGTNNESFGSCMKQGAQEASALKIDRAFIVQFSDTDIGKRSGRALFHASILCGGTKAVSPF